MTTLVDDGVVAPPYFATGDEQSLFRAAHSRKLPILIKGPTGCGKTRLVESMAAELGRPLISVACHEDLTAADLVGRYLLEADRTVWVDGPLTRAVRTGAICYLDEVVEARQDTTVVLHPLLDHRRVLEIERTGESLVPAEGFGLVVSYNPGYQSVLKDLKESTRQRMVALSLTWARPEVETEIIQAETGVSREIAESLVSLAVSVRGMDIPGLREVASTRTLVTTAHLYAEGVDLAVAARAAVGEALTDDERITASLGELIDAWLPSVTRS